MLFRVDGHVGDSIAVRRKHDVDQFNRSDFADLMVVFQVRVV